MSNKTVTLRRSPRDLSSSKVTNLVIASSVGGNPTNTSPLNTNNTNNNNESLPETKIATSKTLLSYEDDEENNKASSEYNINQVVMYNKTRVTINEILLPADDFQDILYTVKNRRGITRTINGDGISPITDSSSYHSSTSNIPDDISFVSSDSTLTSRKSYSSSQKSRVSFTSTFNNIQSAKVKAMELKLVENERLLKRLLNNDPVICEATTVTSTIPTPMPKTVLDDANVAHGTFFKKNYSNNHNTSSDTPQEMVYLVDSITKAISNSNPHTTLKLGKFKDDDIKNFLHTTITQLTSMRYYHPLLNGNKSFVSHQKATLHPTEDSSLYISLSHVIPSHTMKILSSDTTTKSGVMILLNLQSKVLIPKSIDSIDKLYGQWCGIRRGEKEAIEEYTARALTFQSELKGTTKEIS